MVYILHRARCNCRNLPCHICLFKSEVAPALRGSALQSPSRPVRCTELEQGLARRSSQPYATHRSALISLTGMLTSETPQFCGCTCLAWLFLTCSFAAANCPSCLYCDPFAVRLNGTPGTQLEQVHASPSRSHTVFAEKILGFP